ncbi:integrator complex subunit 11 [Zopfochytrium polystomum]|nr:integrator complex subunit 11 [Zopfochytrium polystomum]
MGRIRCVPLGAGQDVGRSCILLTIGDKNVMLDCGLHMAYNDDRKWPDFSYLSKSGNFNEVLDCIIISHFHLDHCGALPYFTEVCGYDGPIYMTHPTRAICPILLEDMRKVVVDRKGESNFFTSDDIRNCLKKVIPVSLQETVQVDEDLEISPYYAGHVLGAAMFKIKVAGQTVYTGDYNMTPDRHLGSAWIDACKPDLLITETTYAVTIRASKRSREQDFLKKVHECVMAGGKVLIPVFALGRAQELCLLVDEYWERMALKVPVYFSAGLTEKANQFYRLFIGWTNEKIKSTYMERNMFDFKHIQSFERHVADEPGPMVVFASPGMLHAGTSLDLFKKWCYDPKNMIILPGYCVPGTVGARVLAGEKIIETEKGQKYHVNLQVKNLSFSAHADAKGILQLIQMAQPRNVMLVHGEARKMAVLKKRIQMEFGIPCFDPGNGSTVTIKTEDMLPVALSNSAFQRVLDAKPAPGWSFEKVKPFSGLLQSDENLNCPRLLDAKEVEEELGLTPVHIRQRLRRPFDVKKALAMATDQRFPVKFEDERYAAMTLLTRALEHLARSMGLHFNVPRRYLEIRVGDVCVLLAPSGPSVIIQWLPDSEQLAARILAVVNSTLQ